MSHHCPLCTGETKPHCYPVPCGWAICKKCAIVLRTRDGKAMAMQPTSKKDPK